MAEELLQWVFPGSQGLILQKCRNLGYFQFSRCSDERLSLPYGVV